MAAAGIRSGGGEPHKPTLADEAVALARQGLPVFPCGPDKKPLPGSSGYKDATTDPNVVRTMFADPRAKFIAVATGPASGIVVLDIDPRHDGHRWHLATAANLPITRSHGTPGGGSHLILRNPAGIDIRNSAGRIARGVDIRGSGGYAIWPPSPGYTIRTNAEPAEMPQWLIVRCRKPEPPPPVRLRADSGAPRYAEAALQNEPSDFVTGKCGITVLRSTGANRLATKRWVWHSALAEWTRISYAAGAWFHPEEHRIGSLPELVAVLDHVRCDPRAFVVRGALAPWVRQQLLDNPERLIRRQKLAKANRGEPTLMEVPQHWVVIDIDGFPLRSTEDLADDPEGPIERAITELLPEPFQDAECWWQLSSSAGFVNGILKAHLFFWLDTPAEDAHIRKVLEQHAPGIDRAPFNAAQPLYVADPIIDGGYDPLPRRTGWRKGLQTAVTLPPLIPGWRKQRPAHVFSGGHGAGIGGDAEDALAFLGDGEGRDGFHVPLRTATMRYAVRCARYGGRDDTALKAHLREAIANAPKKRDHQDWEEYCKDEYLDRLINGAFARVVCDPDAPAALTPDVIAPSASVEDARRDLRVAIGGFLNRTAVWWGAGRDSAKEPEHGAVRMTTGIGKSSIVREELPGFIAAQKAAGKPHRILWLVPHHRLSEETIEAMTALGLQAAIMRGREAKLAPDSDEPMCSDLKAVKDALLVGADIEKAVCGSGKKSQSRCPFLATCAYQRQKDAVRAADVVIAAHQHLFHNPDAMGTDFALMVVDESWWQSGLNPGRQLPATGFADAIRRHPVLWGSGKSQKPDDLSSQELFTIANKADAVFAATAIGQHITRKAVIGAGLTAAEAATATKLEWARKRDPGITPGMSQEARREAVRQAEVNSTLARRVGVWHAIAEVLQGDQPASGRLQITEGKNGSKELLLHSRRTVHEDLAGLPILLLDATLPIDIVRYFLPRIRLLADLAVCAPHMTVTQVMGGWGKTSLIPNAGVSTEENKCRDGKLGELRDFVAFHGERNAVVILYQQIEDRFTDLADVFTAHFNAFSGLDSFGTARALFVIGRPLPAPSELRALALALTGRVVPEEEPALVMRGALMTDGTGVPLQVRAYADPDLEAVRAAITDAEVVQAIGRGRGINRSAATPLFVWVFADVLLPLPLGRLPICARPGVQANQGTRWANEGRTAKHFASAAITPRRRRESWSS